MSRRERVEGSWVLVGWGFWQSKGLWVYGVAGQQDEVLLCPWVDRQIANQVALGDDNSGPTELDGMKGGEKRRGGRGRVRGRTKPHGRERLCGADPEVSSQIRRRRVFARERTEDGQPAFETLEVRTGEIHGRDVQRLESRPKLALGIEKADGQAAGQGGEFGEEVRGINLNLGGAQGLPVLHEPPNQESGGGPDGGKRHGGRVEQDRSSRQLHRSEGDRFERSGSAGGKLEPVHKHLGVGPWRWGRVQAGGYRPRGTSEDRKGRRLGTKFRRAGDFLPEGQEQ